MKRSFLAAATAAVLTAVAASPALAADTTGPSSSTAPYLHSVSANTSLKALLTTGDDIGGYTYGGIPDGIGAYRPAGSPTVTLYNNHELTSSAGITRAHGQKGAYVSKWTYNGRTDVFSAGSDLIQSVGYYDYLGRTFGAAPAAGGVNPLNPSDTFATLSAAFSRFCSSSLTPAGALNNSRTGRGYNGQIYFANEETGDEGRVFGVTVGDGVATQLPRLGQASMENNVVSPLRNTDATVVINDEDGGANTSQLRIYKGTKKATGSALRRAGLTNGSLFVLDAANAAVTNDTQWRSTYGKGVAGDVDVNPINWNQSGAKQNAQAAAEGLGLTRIEDGAFDPRHPDDYYFVTTEGGGTAANPAEPGVSRDGGGLWKLSFDDVKHPEGGGTLTLLLDGTEAPYLSKPDNLDIDRNGNIMIQEDPGNNDHVARIVAYRISDGKRGVVAAFNDDQFKPGGANFITKDEESSGIIDAQSLLGPGYWLFDAQVHKTVAPNPDPNGLVEGGQLLKLKISDYSSLYDIS